MHEKTYVTKTKGSSKYRLYPCHIKHIFGVNIEDLIALLGADAAVRLLHFYGGTCMHIPSKETIRKRVYAAIVKRRCIELLNEGKTRNQVIYQLHREKIRYSKNTLKMKMVKWFGESQDKEMFNFKDAINANILLEVATNYDLFRDFGIL